MELSYRYLVVDLGIGTHCWGSYNGYKHCIKPMSFLTLVLWYNAARFPSAIKVKYFDRSQVLDKIEKINWWRRCTATTSVSISLSKPGHTAELLHSLISRRGPLHEVPYGDDTQDLIRVCVPCPQVEEQTVQADHSSAAGSPEKEDSFDGYSVMALLLCSLLVIICRS